MSWHVCFASPLPLLLSRSPPCVSRCVLKRRATRACTEPASTPPSTSLAASKPAPLVNKRDTPAIFNGPEAVLAVLLAAAALLADFVRNVARLSAAGAKQTLDLNAAESTVAELREALRISREVLDETQNRLTAVSDQRADAQLAVAEADQMRQKMDSANQYAQSAQQQLQKLQRALSRVQQKRSDTAQEQERVDAERQRVETQIAEKRLLLDQLCEQIETARDTEMKLKQRLEHQQALLTKQMQQTGNMPDTIAAGTEAEDATLRGGDASRSEMSLQEIKRNLNAERLALSADVREAQVASEAMTQEKVDELQLLKREMKAKRDGIRARLKKAQTTVDREENEIQRREEAIDQILGSIETPDDEKVIMDGVKETEKKSTVKKRSRKPKQEVIDNDVSAVDESEARSVKRKSGKKSPADDSTVEETLRTATEVGVDAGEDKTEALEEASTSEEKDVKASSTRVAGKGQRRKVGRSRKGAASASTAPKTRTRKSTRKKRNEMDEDQPLTFQEASEVRQAMMDMLDTGIDPQVLQQEGYTFTEMELQQMRSQLPGGAEIEGGEEMKDDRAADGDSASTMSSMRAKEEGAAGAASAENTESAANVEISHAGEKGELPRPKRKRSSRQSQSGPSS